MGQLSQSQDLGAGLKSRHVTMLSIAGVIGASLFVGSSVAIAEATARYLEGAQYHVSISHRDLSRANTKA